MRNAHDRLRRLEDHHGTDTAYDLNALRAAADRAAAQAGQDPDEVEAECIRILREIGTPLTSARISAYLERNQP